MKLFLLKRTLTGFFTTCRSLANRSTILNAARLSRIVTYAQLKTNTECIFINKKATHPLGATTITFSGCPASFTDSRISFSEQFGGMRPNHSVRDPTKLNSSILWIDQFNLNWFSSRPVSKSQNLCLIVHFGFSVDFQSMSFNFKI